MTAITARDTIRRIMPRWLQRGRAEALTYAIAVHLDLLIDMASDAVKRRFPGYNGDYDSLALIGQERRIRRGPNEANAIYAARLEVWLDAHRTRGGPYALLDQLGAYYAAAPFAIDLVYRVGTRFLRDALGSITRDAITWNPDNTTATWDDPGSWDDALGAWDFDSPQWPWWWLFYRWPSTITSDGTWADAGSWSDGGVWDTTLTLDEVASIRGVPADFNAAHTQGTIVLLGPTGELWDYPPGVWNDAGVWGDGSDVAVMRV